MTAKKQKTEQLNINSVDSLESCKKIIANSTKSVFIRIFLVVPIVK